MNDKKNDKWVMPTYLEKYRDLIGDTGGNPIEDLMNDTETNAFNNAFRAAMIVSVYSQIILLEKLHKKGLIY